MSLKVIIYLVVFVVSNLIVVNYGATGLIFTSLLLIPVDFVIRCVFHEQWSGFELVWKLGLLVMVSAALTYLINQDAKNIAIASVSGYVIAQACASAFYQMSMSRSYFFKVNGSDLLAIIVDSIIFQTVAFDMINWNITLIQILLKVIGGLVWYYVFFKWLKIQKSWS